MSLPKEIASRQELIEAQSPCLEPHFQLHKLDVPKMRHSARHTRRHPRARQPYNAFPISRGAPHQQGGKIRGPLSPHANSSPFQVLRKGDHQVLVRGRTRGRGSIFSDYGLTPLVEGRYTKHGAAARFLIDPIVTEPWHHLSGWFCNDLDTPFKTKHGRTVWEYTSVDKEFNVVLNEAMACDAGFLSCILNEEFAQVFKGFESMVDVGGGTGATAMAIAAANPGLKCVVFDLPHDVGGLRGCGNLSFVSGDMFECIPQANAIFMKFILHDWDDEDCVKILKKFKEALTSPSNKSGGKVIIVEIVMDDEKESHEAEETKLFIDMQMLNLVKGKERSEEEWAKLFLAAGFSNYKVARLLGLRSIIEVFP